MARQNTSTRRAKALTAATVGLGVIALTAVLNVAAAQVSDLLCTAMGVALRVLPCILVTAFQVLLGSYLQGLLPHQLDALVSFWPLHVVLGAVVFGDALSKTKALAALEKAAKKAS